MPVRDIREYPEQVLRKGSQDVTDFGEELQSLLRDMWETMAVNDGVGLAAPRDGRQPEVAVIGWRDRRIVLVNPVVIEQEGEEELEEGCLRAPGFSKGHAAGPVVVEAQGRARRTHKARGGGFLARVLMHEIDHLEGKLFLDRLSPLKRRYLKKKLQKRVEK